jgi:hypothetical protein
LLPRNFLTVFTSIPSKKNQPATGFIFLQKPKFMRSFISVFTTDYEKESKKKYKRRIETMLVLGCKKTIGLV